MSSRAIQITNEPNVPEASLEVWLQPRRIWDFGTFMSFYKPGNRFQFSVHQSQIDVLLRIEAQDDQHHTRTANLVVNDAFRKTRPTFLTITAGPQGTIVYIDGVRATSAPEFPLSANTMTGQLVLGDSPGQSHGWAGEMRGFAIYHQQLTATQTFSHYATWEQTGRPLIAQDERMRALYLFHEHTGVVIRDEGRFGMNLNIPERYQVMDKIVLQSFWTEFEMSRNYFMAAVKNVVGFIPFGFCLYAYLLTLRPRGPASLVTVFLGAAVSFTIEILQGFLPTRDSGTTDIITNTMGTWVGVAAYNLFIPILLRFAPRLPLPYRPAMALTQKPEPPARPSNV
jgi:VanZ family protein